jgi:hypothetical protein
MANVKISELTASSTPLAGTEVLPIVQSGATVKVSVANLTAGRAITATSLNGLAVSQGAGSVATNTAVGTSALASNTTGAFNTAIGYQASNASTTGASNVIVGYQAGRSNIGDDNVAVGTEALQASTASSNTAIGRSSLVNNTTGSSGVAVGYQALAANTTGINNTAVGYQAAYSNTTGEITAFGRKAGYANTTATACVYVGDSSGFAATGSSNTFIGYDSGNAITTGAKNTIIGKYTGNQGGLDIRTASNYIVLSDGDGNPRAYINDSGKFIIGAAASSSDRFLVNGPAAFGQSTDTNVYISFLGGTNYLGGSGTIRMNVGAGGVQLTSGATSWASASDERLKDIIEPITGAMAKVNTLRTVMGKYKTDAEGTRRPFLIAQDVIAVLPEAVDSVADPRSGDETEYMSVRYTDTIPLLVAAIKEQQAIITTLTERITALEGA